MDLNEFIEKSLNVKESRVGDFQDVRPCIIMEDGERMSVQASRTHYCDPRIDSAAYYSSFEIGFPTFIDERLRAYAEKWDDPTDTIYAYVPREIIVEIIDDHGGISKEQELL